MSGTDTGSMMDRSRRGFLKQAVGIVAAGAVATPLRALTSQGEERALDLNHTHTGERLSVTYFADGDYLDDGLAEVNRFLRDFRTEDVRAMDPRLLDILHDLRLVTGNDADFEVISAYRSPKTNEILRRKSSSVGEKSLHMQGRAIDVRLTGYDTARLRDVAITLGRGGVGYYPRSDFIHIDTGRVRRW